MSHRKPPERRTFLQDRLEILIKRQKSGKATFNELTELDYIVNSDPEIRKRIIMENMLMDDPGDLSGPSDYTEQEEIALNKPVKHTSWFNQIKSWLSDIFNLQYSGSKNLSANTRQIVLL
ncbi:hypothetical protein JN11_02390 [Mucilaginibacter frigoritolerans]|uniref:Uncharacterized protein n=1 Tax=Mucilaginibacter frigoritolerans TaxID=652788 RepID=A0A562U3P8_9SPHI|nr:hypothetical protein [Mucilaginibacter frigoritolerans]TWI99974.1 hypothetical protein JN11_02390 [Mucilaginibacter frigoritolerans]